MKNTKTIIILNCVLLLIALYTFRSIYKPSILHFNDSDVNLKYGVKGGVTFFQLFQLFPHYLNLAIFYVLNTVYIIRSFRKKHREGIIIAIISILLMLSMYYWKENVTENPYYQYYQLKL